MPELKLGYVTLGDPKGETVVILHGTAGTAAGLLSPAFGGELFGPGQPLDATKYFIVIPDALGIGASSKPSDGMRAGFPRYNYDDIVLAQYRLLTEGLQRSNSHMVLGNSTEGMHTWLWGLQYPDYMDVLVPMASMPSAMSGRNWMMRRLIIESIRNDPERIKKAIVSKSAWSEKPSKGQNAITFVTNVWWEGFSYTDKKLS